MKMPTQPYRLHLTVQDLDRAASARTLAPRLYAGSRQAAYGLGGQPCGTFCNYGPYAAAAQQARSLGYSVPYNAIACGVGSCLQVVNPDSSYTVIIDWDAQYPPTRWTPQSGLNADGSVCSPPSCADSLVLPPKAVWVQMIAQNAPALYAEAAFQQNVVNAVTGGSAAACVASGGIWNSATGQCTDATPPAPPVYNPNPGGTTSGGGSGGSAGGTLSFATSRGNNALQAGDTWTISIRGAAPNQAVSVYGGPNGNFQTNAEGTTDGSGNYTLQGQITPDIQTGTWTETWNVGGASVGTFSFTVGTGVAPAGGGGVTGGSTGGSTGGDPFAGLGLPATIAGINSTYVLLGGGALLLLLMMRR